MKLTHGSLFTGIGGFDLGAERTGIKTLWTCEIDKKNRELLKQHFPNTTHYEDIKELNSPEYVDIITGGFPCQDISVNGKGEGINGDRSGLWFEMLRICSQVRPQFIVIENAPTLTNRGLCTVLSNLAEIGYHAEWQCLSNEQFGFPHKRERCYIIAYSMRFRSQNLVQIRTSIKSIFRQPKKTGQNDAVLVSDWIRHEATNRSIGNNVRVSNYLDRVKAIGNAVNPVITEYLFTCIIKFINENSRQIR